MRYGSGISAADTGVAGADTGGGGGAAAASDEDDELEPLDLEAAAAVKRELLSGEDWASAVIAFGGARRIFSNTCCASRDDCGCCRCRYSNVTCGY